MIPNNDASPQGQPHSPKEDSISDSILLAVVTAAAYLIAFSYEAMYLLHFSVPLQFVHISADSVLVVAATIVGSLTVFFWGANLVAMIWPENRVLQIKLARLSIVVVSVGWALRSYGLRREVLWYIFPLASFVAFEFIWPLIIYRRAGRFIDRFTANEVSEDKFRRRGLFGRLLPVLGRSYLNLILAAFIGIFLAVVKGDGDATTQEEFFVLSSEPNTAVVRFYPDLVVCIHFDASNRTIEPGLQLRRLSADHPLSLDRRSIGPLRQKPILKQTPVQARPSSQRLPASPTSKPILATPPASTPGTPSPPNGKAPAGPARRSPP